MLLRPALGEGADRVLQLAAHVLGQLFRVVDRGEHAGGLGLQVLQQLLLKAHGLAHGHVLERVHRVGAEQRRLLRELQDFVAALLQELRHPLAAGEQLFGRGVDVRAELREDGHDVMLLFAGRVVGHGVHEAVPARAFVARKIVARDAEVVDLLHREIFVLPHDVGDDRLAARGVRHARHDAVLHAGAAVEDLLDLRGIDVLAHAVERLEVAHLRADVDLVFRGVELGDRPDGADAGEQVLPEALHVVAEGRDRAEAGDGHPAEGVIFHWLFLPP